MNLFLELLDDLRTERRSSAADHLRLGQVLLGDVGVEGHHHHQGGHHVEVCWLILGKTEAHRAVKYLYPRY